MDSTVGKIVISINDTCYLITMRISNVRPKINTLIILVNIKTEIIVKVNAITLFSG